MKKFTNQNIFTIFKFPLKFLTVILRKVFSEIGLKLLTGHIVEVVYAGKTVVGQLSSCMTSDLQFASRNQDTVKKAPL